MSKLVTLSETAQQLGISVAAVRDWRLRRKHLDFVKVGRSVRVPQTSIDKLIESHTLPPNLDSAEEDVLGQSRRSARGNGR